jgi:cytochrome c5
MRQHIFCIILLMVLSLGTHTVSAQQKLPTGVIEIKPAVPVPAASAPDAAQVNYRQTCAVCHNGTLQHAPDFTDAAVREQLKTRNVDTLVAGFARGNPVHEAVMGNARLDEETLRTILAFLLSADAADLN